MIKELSKSIVYKKLYTKNNMYDKIHIWPVGEMVNT